MFFTLLRQKHIYSLRHFFSGRGIWGIVSRKSLFIRPFFSLYVELICWTAHLLARKDQTPCQVNDVCGVSCFCTWLWMLRFICRNYREEETRSVFCLFHAPVDFLIQRRRRMHTSESPASTLLLYTGDHHRGRKRGVVLGPQSSSSENTWFFFPIIRMFCCRFSLHWWCPDSIFYTISNFEGERVSLLGDVDLAWNFFFPWWNPEANQ